MKRLTTIVAAAFLFSAPLYAQAPQSLQIHGFADWGTGHSSGGTYEYASRRGTMSPGTFALVMSAIPGPRIAVVGQVGFNGIGQDVTEPKLDIIFAQYTVSDAF